MVDVLINWVNEDGIGLFTIQVNAYSIGVCACIELLDRAETSLLDMYGEILVENETTEQMNNETAQQVSERNRF